MTDSDTSLPSTSVTRWDRSVEALTRVLFCLMFLRGCGVRVLRFTMMGQGGVWPQGLFRWAERCVAGARVRP